MASIEALAPFMEKGHEEALRVLREYGTAEDVEALDRIRGNAISPSVRAPEIVNIYQAVMLGALARAFEDHVKPKPRGRPRKGPSS